MFNSTRIILFLCFFFFYGWTKQFIQEEDNYYIINSGKGVASIELGKSTIKDVKKTFGWTWVKLKIKKVPRHREIAKTRIAQYKKLGLEIIASRVKGWGKLGGPLTIDLITMEKPFKGKTKEGIVLGKSRKEEVVKLYGQPEFILENEYSYPKLGIDFLISEDSNNVVNKIRIYLPVR